MRPARSGWESSKETASVTRPILERWSGAEAKQVELDIKLKVGCHSSAEAYSSICRLHLRNSCLRFV